MELITNLSIICIVMLLVMQATRRPLAETNRISGSHYRYSPMLILAFCFALTFVAAFRQEFQDTGTYKILYTNIGSEYADAFDKDFAIQEYGFNLFMIALKKIDSDPQFLVIVSAIISVPAYLFTIRAYAKEVPFSLFLFFCITFISTMNGIRQILACAMFSMALPWLRDRKIIPYILLVLFLSTFHSSIIVMIPLYFIIVGKRMNKGIWFFLILIVMCFVAPAAANQVMGVILEDSLYVDYLENESKMGLMRFLVALIPTLVVVLYCWVQRGNYDGENKDSDRYLQQRMIDVLINMQIISFGFTALGLQMVYFARISMYFACVLPLLLPVAIQGCFTKESAHLVKGITIVMYLFFHIYQIYTYEALGGWNLFKLAF